MAVCRVCTVHTILTTIWARGITFRKCVDVCVTFKMIQTITVATHKTQNELSSFLGANFLNCVSVLFSNIPQHFTCYRLGARVAPL